jgi:hypothetical protein
MTDKRKPTASEVVSEALRMHGIDVSPDELVRIHKEWSTGWRKELIDRVVADMIKEGKLPTRSVP